MGCVKLILCKDNIIFEQMQVVDEIAITKEDENHSVLIEAVEVASSGYPHWGKTYYDKVDMQKQMKDLLEENDDLKRRMVVVENEVVRMKRLLKKLRKKKRHGRHMHIRKQQRLVKKKRLRAAMETCQVEKVDENQPKGEEGHGAVEADPQQQPSPVDEPVPQPRRGKRKRMVMEFNEEKNVHSNMFDKLYDHCTDHKLVAERPKE